MIEKLQIRIFFVVSQFPPTTTFLKLFLSKGSTILKLPTKLPSLYN